MTGELELGQLMRGMSAHLTEGVYVFVTVGADEVPPSLAPRMTFHEAEGTTLILLAEEAEAQGWKGEFPSRMITLEVHSSLEAVGFLAAITTALAAEGMGVNPVAGFYHDHLFVPAQRASDALAVLEGLAKEAGGGDQEA